MCVQESALYGKLILHLRDRAAELLAVGEGDLEEEKERLDQIIHNWFFEPQKDLHGCAPRDLIWAEQRGDPNPIHPEHLNEFFFDDCPICQEELEHVRTALSAGEDHGWQWHYDDGGFPLIARYDPEGWDDAWSAQEARLEEWSPSDEMADDVYDGLPVAEAYEPFPAEAIRATPEEFSARLRHPWLDPALHLAAQILTDRLDCPEPSLHGLDYRPISYEEALSLAIGLYEQGIEVEGLLAQIEAFPYQNVALDWLSRPAESVRWLVEAMEQEDVLGNEAEVARLRHHRDFILLLAELVPLGAQLWLQGWLDAVAHGALARAAQDDL